MKKWLLLPLLLTGLASAHTAIIEMAPAQNATVRAPKMVSMTFGEAIDLHFVTVKVYPLAATGDKLALNRAAADLAKTALGDKNDADKRIDLLKIPSDMTMATAIKVPLKTPVKPGNYAVMWRLLSEDGHVVSGQSVFTVK